MLASLFFVALSAAAPAPAPVLLPNTIIEAPGPQGPLQGTMQTSGTARAPIVLIVPGSGPTDRDGDNPLGVRAATYRLLAEGLARQGVTSVRVDKRGMFGSARAIANANAVTIDDYATDVHVWVRTLRARTKARCVWVLGHSEGGLVALAAGRKPDGICGLVLVAAPGRPLGAILRDQLRANPANAPILGQALPAIDALEAGRRVDVSGFHPALQPLFAPAVQGFLISAMALDPVKLIGTFRKPVLVVQGGADIQVDINDATLLRNAAPKGSLAVFLDANHVLKTVSSSDRAANLATYADPNLPLAAGVAEQIAAFVKGTRSR